jgi:ABC-type multidrug transport system fused ATPase/permease subunit
MPAAAASARSRGAPQSAPPESSTWRQLNALLGDQRREVAVLGIASVLTGFTESGILAILAQTASALVDGSSRVRITLGPLNLDEKLGILFAIGIGLGFVRLALQGVISVVPARMAAHTQERLRREVFGTFTRASWGEQARDREGHLQELMTNQVNQATQSTVQAATLMTVSLTFLVLVISAFVLNVVAALLVLVAAAALSFGLRPLSKLGNRRSRELSRAMLQYASGINEAVRLAEESHVFGTEAAQRERADSLQGNVRSFFYPTLVLARLVPGIYQSLIYLLVMMALAGLYAVGTGHVASLGAVVLLLVRAGAYGQQGQGAYQTLRQSLPYIERLEHAQKRYGASTPVTGSKRLQRLHVLSFTDVSFAYEPDRTVLSHINFEVAGGETIGVIGPSGTGKSTLVQILLGLRAPDSGQYLINGVAADQYSRDDWHARIAYVPQEPRLLHASVAENIRFFRPIDDAAIESAARLAGIHDDVVSWSEGYETIIGPRADAVSGGQQQRICLARALADNPQVLVLDEPTSALDPRAESLIQQSLAGLKEKLTLFVVAHRMSTLDISGRVMVIVDGRLEAFARLSELAEKSPYYRSASTGRSGAGLILDRAVELGNGHAAPAPETSGSGLLAAVRGRIAGPR